MSRPKRQRPAWLPTFIPYKDGRYLGLAKQTILAWTSALLALVFFSMTASFATERSRLSNIKFVYSSRSNTILVLRVLSEAASVFLAATVYSTFEVIQWVLISRAEGIRLPQFLALHPSTGPLGLMALALGRGLLPSEWPMKPRLMSLLRLAATSAIPVLGILVMSNVDTEAVYIPQKDTTKPIAFGMKPFNGSVASQLDVWVDMTFNTGYVTFLNNPLHSIDVTSASERKGCAKGAGLSPNDHCTRRILITQEYQNVEANFPGSWKPQSRVILSSNQQIYELEYRDNIDVPLFDLHCQDFVSGPARYRLCMSNAEDGSIQATMKICPAKLIVSDACAEDTEWQSSKGFTTSVRAAFVDADVSYTRIDGRILSHQVKSDPRPANINASELLGAMTLILDATMAPPGAQASNPILGSYTHLFGRVVAGHMYRISKLLESNPAASVKGTNSLQSLIGITLFFCQNGVLGQTVLLPFTSNSTSVKDYYSSGAFEKQNATAMVALADTRYRIDVGRATLIAYIVLGGVTLLIAITALVIGSILELVKFDAEPTLWPALDFYTQCRVEDHNGKVVAANKRTELAWIHDGRQLFKDIEGLRVTRRKRQLRPYEEPPGPVELTENDRDI